MYVYTCMYVGLFACMIISLELSMVGSTHYTGQLCYMYIHVHIMTFLVEVYLHHLEDEEMTVSETDKQLRVTGRRVHAFQQTFQSLRRGSNGHVICTHLDQVYVGSSHN